MWSCKYCGNQDKSELECLEPQFILIDTRTSSTPGMIMALDRSMALLPQYQCRREHKYNCMCRQGVHGDVARENVRAWDAEKVVIVVVKKTKSKKKQLA